MTYVLYRWVLNLYFLIFCSLNAALSCGTFLNGGQEIAIKGVHSDGFHYGNPSSRFLLSAMPYGMEAKRAGHRSGFVYTGAKFFSGSQDFV